MKTSKTTVVLCTSVLLLLVTAALVVWSGVHLIKGERVSFRNGEIELNGMLALPRWKTGRFPAAIIVPGSGPTTWSDLKSYARRLVPHGLAVLMYDKRGTGKSGGQYSIVSVSDSEQKLRELATDAAAAVEFLKRRVDIDASRIGLIGGSQAGWIIPQVAASHSDVALMIIISGPAVTYGQEIYYSQLTGDDPGVYVDLPVQEIRRRLDDFKGPHGFDPLPVLERLTVPSLWIIGGQDKSVPMHVTMRNLKKLGDDRPGVFEVKFFPEGDHSLRNYQTGRRIAYWPDVYTWLDKRGFL